MKRTSFLAVLGVMALLAAACGGGGSETEDAASTTSSAEGSATDAATTVATTAAPTGPAGPDVVEAFRLQPQDPAPVPSPSAAPTAIEHLDLMVREVVGSLIADDDVFDGMTLPEMDDDYPVLGLDVIAARASSDGEVFGIIQAYSEVGAAAGYPDGVYEIELEGGIKRGIPIFPTSFFEVRAQSADQMRQVSELALQLIAEVRATEWGVIENLPGSEGVENVSAQGCLFEILNGSRGCSQPRLSEEVEEAVESLAGPFTERDWRDFGLADDVDDGLVLDPLCEAWERALAHHGVAPDVALALDVALDDSFLDTRFLGRSECRRWWADLDEDPEPDVIPGEQAVAQVLAAAADAAAGHDEINESAYDTAGRSDAPRDYYSYETLESLATMDVLSALVDAARSSFGDVYDPETRAQLMLIAHAGGHALNSHARWVQYHELLLAQDDDFIACFEEDAQTCPPPADELLRLDFENFVWNQYEEIDLELLDESRICAIWNAQLDRLGPDAGFQADYVISSLRELEELTAGADDCVDSTGDTADG